MNQATPLYLAEDILPGRTVGHFRKLMSHCSGSDTVLGSVNVGGSIVILLLIGFVVGFASSWFVFWRRQQRRIKLDLEFRENKQLPAISNLTGSAQEPVLAGKGSLTTTEEVLPRTTAALNSGPLNNGLQDVNIPTQQGSLQPSNSSHFTRTGNVNTSAACLVGGRGSTGPLARSVRQGKARSSNHEESGRNNGASHFRSGTVVINQAADASRAAQGVSIAASDQPSDYAAAIARTASGKHVEKQELLQQVQNDRYEEQDLDPEWTELLQELDDRMLAAGRQTLNSKERAVAIRSLIVATASQTAEAALNKAMHDVEVYRKAQKYMK